MSRDNGILGGGVEGRPSTKIVGMSIRDMFRTGTDYTDMKENLPIAVCLSKVTF